HFPEFIDRRWCNFTQMKRALRSCRVPFTVLQSQLPRRGLALVQWLGPWISNDFGGRKSLKYTHWIATAGDQVFDHTEPGWMPMLTWEQQIAAGFLQEISGATGWAVKIGIELMNSNTRLPSAATEITASFGADVAS